MAPSEILELPPSLEDLQQYLNCVIASKVMGRSQRRLKLLEHILNEEIEGRGHDLKAYSIGLDVFDKDDDFDPTVDSIVRVEMGRLRLALAAFEGSRHSQSRIKVTIPKGSYRPEISLRQATSKSTSSVELRRGFMKALSFLAVFVLVPVMAIGWYLAQRPLPNLDDIVISVSNFEGPSEIAPLVKATLLSGLSHASSINVIVADNPTGDTVSNFKLTGSITQAEEGFIITSELLDTELNSVKWAKSVEAPDVSQLQNVVETRLTPELRVQLYGAIKVLLERRDIYKMSPEELFLLATWVPGPATNSAAWEEERVSLARMALAKDPDFGKAHSVLVDKLAFLANMHPTGNLPNVPNRIEFHAQRALELAPQDPDVLFNVAQGLWHAGRAAESERLMKRVVELDKSHDLARFLSLVTPFTCIAAPDAILHQAVEFDQSLSPDNPIRWIMLTWIGRLHANRKEWDDALEAVSAAGLIFEVPKTSMRRAVILNELGRTQEAVEIIHNQKKNWPSFSATHIANVTMPRVCAETTISADFFEPYRKLANIAAQAN